MSKKSTHWGEERVKGKGHLVGKDKKRKSLLMGVQPWGSKDTGRPSRSARKEGLGGKHGPASTEVGVHWGGGGEAEPTHEGRRGAGRKPGFGFIA